jgi:hypothetical protein
MLFAAFISYKHTEPDRKWAAWLHKKLETYRVPRGIPAPQLGTRRIGRVFRDDEELAAGDLSGAIKAALASSEYLIVVCSPSTPASDYVNQEIREFAALGRPDKILALLVSGEPSDSFPAALRECAPEPLAADVRTNTVRSRNQAFLRIMAALLNCTFDQLAQRERQRTKRRIQFVSAIIAICVFLVAAIRYGLNRLSLERTSIGTYGLLVSVRFSPSWGLGGASIASSLLD